MKATELLKQQHDEIRAMLEQLHKSDNQRRAPERVEALARMLAAHMVVEEELFYPAIRESNEGQVLEGLEEHVLSKFALKRVMEVQPDDETFGAKVEVLKELTDHHLDEEEKDMFKAAEKVLGGKSEKLCERMKSRFDEAEKQPYLDVSAESQDSAPEGEGSYSATREYNAGVARTVASGRTEALAREAKRSLEGTEGAELKRAERLGLNGGTELGAPK